MPDTDFFWERAQPFLDRDLATQGTMMGFPCLRADGQFFASADPATGDLIVKLPADRVDALIQDGTGAAFAPSGRRFREWIRIPDRDAERWDSLMEDGLRFVSSDR